MKRVVATRLTAVALLVSLAATGCTALHPSITMPDDRDEVAVPLHRGGNLYFMAASVNGRPEGHFLLDTGSQSTVIAPKAASHLASMRLFRWKLSGVGGEADGHVRHIGSIRVGDMGVGPHLVPEVPLERLLGEVPSGVLGSPLLWDLPFTIDLRAETITFHRRDTFHPPAAAVVADLAFDSGRPLVRATLDGRHEGWFLMDTGADTYADLEPGFVARFPDYAPGPQAPSGMARGIGGTITIRRGELSRLDLLGHTFRDVPFSVEQVKSAKESASAGAESDPRIGPHETIGMLGICVMREFRLTFDYRRRKLWAEYRGWPSLTERLAGGEDLSEPDVLGQTPLYCAVEDSNWGEATELIAAGVDVNRATPKGFTPLMAAAWAKSADLVRKLLAAGADPNAANDEGGTALMFAAQSGDEESVVALLLRGANVKAVTKNGTMALIPASIGNSPQAIKALVQMGADIEAANKDEATALTVAAFYGKDEAVETLLALGAKVDVSGKYGATPLWVACQEDHPNVVRRLLAAGANVNTPTQQGITPLAQACHQEHPDVAAILIEAGADVRAADEDGDTPLMAAAAHGLTDTVRLLVDHGADVAARNKKGRTAADMARRNGHREIADLLSAAAAERKGAGR